MNKVDAGYDILTDPLFTVMGLDGSTERLALSELLARLVVGPDVETFPRLAAEQRGHWWRFLVRCGAKALRGRGWTVEEAAALPAPQLSAALRDTLRAAAGDPDGGLGVWALFQPRPQRPGFLQPPTPTGEPPEVSNYALNTLSLLTSAIGSKNHERKVDGARTLDAEQVVYALVDLQLGAVFGGRGNYPSQIMGSASGAGSGAPFMAARLGTGENETFRHDTAVLLTNWERLRDEHGLRGGIWALWTEGWDGESSLPSHRLDPAFVPLARLIRLSEPAAASRFVAVWFRASKKARVEDLTGGGNFGDPFTPTVPDVKNSDTRKVRGTLSGGYGYSEIANLLFGADGNRPGIPSASVRALRHPLQDHRSDVRVLFEGTAFEQGKTVGFYQREVLLPASAQAWLGEARQPMREVHEELIQRVKAVKSALNGAGRILLSGEPKPRDGDARKIAAPAERLDAVVDLYYLDALLDAAERHERNEDGWRGEWPQRLTGWAITAFLETMDTIPTAAARRYEREVRARNWLDWRLHRLREEAGGAARGEMESPDLELAQ